VQAKLDGAWKRFKTVNDTKVLGRVIIDAYHGTMYYEADKGEHFSCSCVGGQCPPDNCKCQDCSDRRNIKSVCKRKSGLKIDAKSDQGFTYSGCETTGKTVSVQVEKEYGDILSLKHPNGEIWKRDITPTRCQIKKGTSAVCPDNEMVNCCWKSYYLRPTRGMFESWELFFGNTSDGTYKGKVPDFERMDGCSARCHCLGQCSSKTTCSLCGADHAQQCTEQCDGFEDVCKAWAPEKYESIKTQFNVLKYVFQKSR